MYVYIYIYIYIYISLAPNSSTEFVPTVYGNIYETCLNYMAIIWQSHEFDMPLYGDVWRCMALYGNRWQFLYRVRSAVYGNM